MRASGHEDADEEDRQDPEQLLHAACTARAELLIARRQRAALHRDVLATHNRLAVANTASEVSQLRISKVRYKQRIGGSRCFSCALYWTAFAGHSYLQHT